MATTDAQLLDTDRAAPLSEFGRLLRRFNLDGPLLGGLLLICALGLIVLYSAVGENMRLLVNQIVRLGVAIVAMLVMAQFPPDFLRRWTPWGFAAGLVLLVLVLTTGEVGQGARRWLDLGMRFQPSEAMKLAVPMMAAWYLHEPAYPTEVEPSVGDDDHDRGANHPDRSTTRPRHCTAGRGIRPDRHRACRPAVRFMMSLASCLYRVPMACGSSWRTTRNNAC